MLVRCLLFRIGSESAKFSETRFKDKSLQKGSLIDKVYVSSCADERK